MRLPFAGLLIPLLLEAQTAGLETP